MTAPSAHPVAPTAADVPLEALMEAAVAAIGGAPREGQQSMAEAVDRAMSGGRHLLVQAGTGTGKSLAYLVPVFHHAGSAGKPVVISTATLALQSQVTGRDVPRVLDALADELGHRPDVALLKGRSNYACLHKVGGGYPADADAALFPVPEVPAGGSEAPAGRLGQQVKRLREWVEVTDTGDRDDVQPGVSDAAWRQISVTARECLGRKCPLIEECFAEKARLAAGEADVVITNHALLAVNAFEGLAVLPEHDVVVVDEAHELRDRVTGAVTGALSAAAVRAAACAVRKHTAAPHDALERAALEHAPLGSVVIAAEPGASTIPLLEARDLVDGHPAAYVCRHLVCERPVTTPENLAASLG